MTIKYRHESGAERTFAGRQRRLDNDPTWERVDDAEAEADAPAGETADTAEAPAAGDVDVETTFPRHKGGGNYELSDGTTMKGQEAAQAAQAELDAARD